MNIGLIFGVGVEYYGIPLGFSPRLCRLLRRIPLWQGGEGTIIYSFFPSLVKGGMSAPTTLALDRGDSVPYGNKYFSLYTSKSALKCASPALIVLRYPCVSNDECEICIKQTAMFEQ